MTFQLHTIMLAFHLVALAIGLGAALMADWVAIRILLGRSTERSAAQLRDLSAAVSVGVGLLWCSGALLVAANAIRSPGTLGNEKVWAKLVIVAILTVNAVALHRVVLPLIGARVGQQLFDRDRRGLHVACALIGALSFVSWVSALYLGLARELNGVVTMGQVLTHYAVAVLAVWVAGIVMCHWTSARAVQPSGTPSTV